MRVKVSLGTISKFRKLLQNLPTQNRSGRKNLLSQTLERKIGQDLHAVKILKKQFKLNVFEQK